MLRCCYTRCLWYPAEPKPTYMVHTLLKKSRQQFITFVITLHSEADLRPDLNPECVLLYQDKQFDQDSQNPSFKNRTQLDIKDGNLTLILHDVKISDTGTYECRVLANRRKQGVDPIHIIHLSVDPPGE